MKGRVLVVGLERNHYKKIEPVLTRALLSTDRIPQGESGLLLTKQAKFDLIIVRHPLTDMALGSFMRRARDEPGSLCQSTPILVLADDSRLDEIRGLLPGGSKEILSVNQPGKLMRQVASKLLGAAARVDTRVQVRLEVQLATGRAVVSCPSEDLSEQGMLLRSDTLYPVGTRIRFDFTLPGDGTAVGGEGQVMRHAAPEVEQVQGIGVKIVGFRGDGQRRLRRFLEAKK